ncbi:MAG: hypothetical protein ACYCX3_02090 [Thermoleophilia bacterium]
MAAIILLLAASALAGVGYFDGDPRGAPASPGATVVLWSGSMSGPGADGLTVRTPDFREEMA